MKTNVIYLSDCRRHIEQMRKADARRSVVGDDTFKMITAWSRLNTTDRDRLLTFAKTMTEGRDDLKV